MLATTKRLSLIVPALVVLSCSCAREPEPPPNVILIVVDALRADHLSCYGYERPTSPNLDRLAQTATLYERAMASGPWTLPTHASMFTGKDPFEHGAHKFRDDMGSVLRNPLPLHHLTLAEMFAREGYATGAVVANDAVVTDFLQFDQGFAVFDSGKAEADVVVERAIAWLDTVGERPFFLFMNFMDTHEPYNARPRPGLLEEPPDPDIRLYKQLRRRMTSKRHKGFPTELARKVIAQYDTAVANADDSIGHLLDVLRQRDLFDSALLVVTSDHGEGFGEHRIAGHGMDVFQNLIWIPLIVKDPAQTSPRRESLTVSTSDIPALIVSQLPEAIRGRVAEEFPNVPGEHPVVSESYFAQSKFAPHRYRIRQAIFDWPYKYIDSSDGDFELFHLEDDPEEEHNLVESEPELARSLAARLAAYLLERPHEEEFVDPGPMTAEQTERLRALGYIDR